MISSVTRYRVQRVAIYLLLLFPALLLGQTKPTPILVSQLATTNPKATIRGEPGDQEAVWDKFDAKEGARVHDAIKEVIQQSEKLWPELIEHLSDDRYCTTIGHDAGYPRNCSVGDICQMVIGQTLSEPYYRHMQATKQVYRRYRIPLAKDKTKLREWCLARKEKKLFELQIELCELIIKDQQESDFTAAVKKEIEGLKKSRQAIPFAGSF
jgi:hypothetical protein